MLKRENWETTNHLLMSEVPWQLVHFASWIRLIHHMQQEQSQQE
jgi:hypothetical protein